MALVTTTNTIPTKVVTFNRRQDNPLDPIQVIRVNFNSNTAGVGAGDVEKLTSNISLPIGYGYKLLNFSHTFYSLSTAEEAAWDSPGIVQIQNDTFSTQYQVMEVKSSQISSGVWVSAHTLFYNQAGPAWQTIDAVKQAPQSSGLTLSSIVYSGTSSISPVSYNVAAILLQYDSKSVYEADIWKIGNLIN